MIRYDHRDTGRFTAAFRRQPYAVTDLAADAVAVLDALAASPAHVMGMSMGGVLVQLLLLDRPDRLRSATVLCTCADPVGLGRGAELADVTAPTLVIEAPHDPVNPPPHSAVLAELIGGARLVSIPGMGHALAPPVLAPLGAAILAHTASADGRHGLG